MPSSTWETCRFWTEFYRLTGLASLALDLHSNPIIVEKATEGTVSHLALSYIFVDNDDDCRSTNWGWEPEEDPHPLDPSLLLPLASRLSSLTLNLPGNKGTNYILLPPLRLLPSQGVRSSR